MLDYSAQDEPAAIIRSVDEYVFSMQQGEVSPADEDADINLSCVWGQQLVRELNWEWANLVHHDHGDASAIGVVSPNRALAIYPLNFISGCLNHGVPVTILLAFNMLVAPSRIPSIAPNSYENLMGMVHHIIPRT